MKASTIQPPVIFVVGPVMHGKTTSREILCKHTFLKGASCSDVIYDCLAFRRGVSVQELREVPKEELRPALIEMGDFLCGQIGSLKEAPAIPNFDDQVFRVPSALIRMLYHSGCNVIDGVRRRLELQHAKEHLEWNGVRSITIHIEDPRKAKIVDNSEDLRDLADELIVNDGTTDDLEKKLVAILVKRFGPQDETPEPITVVDLPAKKTEAAG